MRLEGRAFDMCLRHASRKFDALEDHCHLHRQHATRARDQQRTRFKFSSHSVLSCCVCIHIAIHARWIASESNRADAPSLQKRINARRTCAPCEKRLTTKSRVTTALACVDTAVTDGTVWPPRAHPKEVALHWKTKPYSKRRFWATPRASRPLQLPGDVLDCTLPDYFDHAVLQGHGSDLGAAQLSALKHDEPVLGRNREKTSPRPHSSSRMEETRAQLHSSSSPICGADGHGGDCLPRQLEKDGHARPRDGGIRTDHRTATSNIICTTHSDSHAAKRRSWQAACKQCLRSSGQHRTFLFVRFRPPSNPGGHADGLPLCKSR